MTETMPIRQSRSIVCMVNEMNRRLALGLLKPVQ